MSSGMNARRTSDAIGLVGPDVGENFGDQVLCLSPLQPSLRNHPQWMVGLGHRVICCGAHARSVTDRESVGVEG